MSTLSEHTPGPWNADHDADGDFGIFWGDTHICTTVSDTTEDEANARLIAACPDMLAALQAIAQGVTSDGAIIIAKAAIAKAEKL